MYSFDSTSLNMQRNDFVNLMLQFSRYILLAILILASLPLMSQEEDKTIITNQIWVDYYEYFYFKPKWEFYGDAGYRFMPEDFTWQMIHARPSIRYIANDVWEVHGGIGFFQTINKNYPNSFEIRPWQGTKIKWPSFKPVYFSHYIRLEERFFIPQGSAMEFNFRLRYRIAVKIDVYRFQNKNLIFVPAYGEVFGNFGPEIQETFRNRARFALGVGYKTHKGWSFEFHFVSQRSKAGKEEKFETSDRLYQIKIRRHLFKKEKTHSKSS